MTISEAIHTAAEHLADSGVPAARFDAELLLRHILGRDRTWIITHGSDVLEGEPRSRFEAAVLRRAKREPLQHITGVQEFWGLDLFVSRDVLIPRPETELVVEASLRAAAGIASPLAVDLCTGSGCIVVCLARELPTGRFFAADRSSGALAIARRNAKQQGVSDRIRFLEGDLFAPLEELDISGTVDVITANPPYVRADDLALLQPEVRDYEPEMALVGGPTGMEIAERIIAAAPAFLRSSGVLVLETGIDQAGALAAFISATGSYAPPETLKDLAEIDRVLVARKK